LKQWADLLTEENIKNWLKEYQFQKFQKSRLILAGNIPLVGFHDVISVVLSNHIPVIKFLQKINT
jgi:hypothetical protein